MVYSDIFLEAERKSINRGFATKILDLMDNLRFKRGKSETLDMGTM